MEGTVLGSRAQAPELPPQGLLSAVSLQTVASEGPGPRTGAKAGFLTPSLLPDTWVPAPRPGRAGASVDREDRVTSPAGPWSHYVRARGSGGASQVWAPRDPPGGSSGDAGASPLSASGARGSRARRQRSRGRPAPRPSARAPRAPPLTRGRPRRPLPGPAGRRGRAPPGLRRCPPAPPPGGREEGAPPAGQRRRAGARGQPRRGGSLSPAVPAERAARSRRRGGGGRGRPLGP